LGTVHLPLHVHERGTVYRQLPPPSGPRSTSKSFFTFKNELAFCFFLDGHFAGDNVYIDCVRRLATVRTVKLR